jgi:hypothetical protein
MSLKVTNNAFGTLNAGISNSDVTIVLEAGQGARFPVLGAGDYFYATLIDTSNNLEIVKVTARATDTMTIVRAQDGTSARVYNVNDRFELRPTAALFNEKADAADVTASLATKVNKAGDTMTGRLAIHNSTETGYASNISESLSKSTLELRPHATDSPRIAMGALASGVAGNSSNGSAYIQRTNGASVWDMYLQPFGGRVLMPNQPAFAARFNTTKAQNTNSPILFDLIVYNQGGHYNGSTGLFTAPVAGLYAINATALRQSGGSSYWELVTAINGSVTNYGTGGYTQTTDLESLTGSWVVALGANDTLAVWHRSASSPVTFYASETFVNGYLIG